jgi:hypothetical protein
MVWVSAMWLVPLYVVGLPALGARAVRHDTMARLAALVVIATVASVGAFFHSQLRYRVPNVDVLLGMFGAACVGGRLQGVLANFRRRPGYLVPARAEEMPGLRARRRAET